MTRMLRLPSTYLALPILLSCGLTCLTYDLPESYLEGVLLLAASAVAILLLDLLFGARLPRFERFRARDYLGTRESFVALAFAYAVMVFCLLDLALFPIPLIDNPSSYANMEGGHEHIRHISDMCWALVPIGLLCARSKWLRYLLIAVGLVFPVLVIDRNRIFASLFSLALVVLFRRDESRPLPWKTVAVLAVAGGTVFSVLGMLRSGTLDTVTLPFSAMYRAAPQGIKWLLLYISAGPYNFGAMLAKHYSNASFLINQLVPMAGSIATAGTGIPLDAPNINVGTEFFPFLMALGPLGAVASILALYAMLWWSVRRLHPPVSLFAWLIFLRMSYVCLMSPFAPQAFTWTNLGFVLLCLVMQVLAAWLPGRAESPVAAAAARTMSPPTFQ
ncbi:oligosaccharide repeat unit polymerase [Dyella flava]|uniref:Oligosaccharide repeat unit polymerase n=1 Tax=Dyella flava TaxID=1920170 RepID=A0ABS2K165_9GAMM|nr:oligosaccharide repeat unit polymerase [Dyella flava]MBM7125001.1 oligosaccharide repeat unit polymerase [Dyella flava]